MRVNSVLNKLFCYDYVYEDNTIYFAAYNMNGIFAYDLQRRVSKLLSYIPNEIVVGGNGYYSGIALYEGKIYLAPCSASSLIVYDIELKKINQIELPETNYTYPQHSKFLKVIVYKDRVLYIPCRFPAIIESDLNGNNIRLHEYNILGDKNILVADACLIGDMIYLLTWDSISRDAGSVLVYHIEKQKFSIFLVRPGWKIYSIYSLGDQLWLMTDCGLVKYDMARDESKEYGVPVGWCKKKQTFKLAYFEDYIWIFTEDGESFCKFNAIKEEYESEERIVDRNCYKYLINNYIAVKVYNSKLFFFNSSAGKMYIFFDGNRQEFELTIPDDYDLNRIIKHCVETMDTFSEGKDLSIFGYYYELDDFLKEVGSITNKQLKAYDNGKEIYEAIR